MNYQFTYEIHIILMVWNAKRQSNGRLPLLELIINLCIKNICGAIESNLILIERISRDWLRKSISLIF